jgi:hypothetical protein
VNPPTAKRCDCGYDFETHTVEKSYYRQEVSKEIKSGLAVIGAYNLVIAVLALVNRNPGGVVGVVLWSALAYALYRELVRRSNFARIVLALLTFPIGTALFLSSDMKLYCQQKGE